jgi:cephalosporin hydroxylase
MNIVDTDLGSNAIIFQEKISKIKDSIFVDLYIRYGISSYIMLLNSQQNNNKVYGIDIHNEVDSTVINNSRYTFIQSDSIQAGKEWDSNNKIDVLFVDTLHIKEHVLGELKVWYPHLKENALVIFHDTNWPEDKRYFYNDQYWDRPEEAVKEFFEVDQLNEDNTHLIMEHYPDSWGMTFVQLKNKLKEFGKTVNWDKVLKFYEKN